MWRWTGFLNARSYEQRLANCHLEDGVLMLCSLGLERLADALALPRPA